MPAWLQGFTAGHEHRWFPQGPLSMLGATADMKLTVMIVDDDAATLEIARGLLEDEGH